jgi:hypothetical protein
MALSHRFDVIVRVARFYLCCACVTCFAIMKLLQVVSFTDE